MSKFDFGLYLYVKITIRLYCYLFINSNHASKATYYFVLLESPISIFCAMIKNKQIPEIWHQILWRSNGDSCLTCEKSRDHFFRRRQSLNLVLISPLPQVFHTENLLSTFNKTQSMTYLLYINFSISMRWALTRHRDASTASFVRRLEYGRTITSQAGWRVQWEPRKYYIVIN